MARKDGTPVTIRAIGKNDSSDLRVVVAILRSRSRSKRSRRHPSAPSTTKMLGIRGADPDEGPQETSAGRHRCSRKTGSDVLDDREGNSDELL